MPLAPGGAAARGVRALESLVDVARARPPDGRDSRRRRRARVRATCSCCRGCCSNRAACSIRPACFYLVQIVLAALVLGRLWTWIVTVLVGRRLCGAVPRRRRASSAPRKACTRRSRLHMRGMWLAFARDGADRRVLVTRLALAIERRDRALEIMRERNARAMRFAGLATLAAGAAHELGTPLATIAVAARELEQRARAPAAPTPDLRDDAQLIRAEIDRCRRLLDDMAGRIAEPIGRSAAPGRVDEPCSAKRSPASRPAERAACDARRGDRARRRLARRRDRAGDRQPGPQWPAGVGAAGDRVDVTAECRARRPRADRRRRSRATACRPRNSRAPASRSSRPSLPAPARASGCSSRARRSSSSAARSRSTRRSDAGTTRDDRLLDADVVRGDHGASMTARSCCSSSKTTRRCASG